MEQEHRRDSQGAQVEDSTTYLNKRIQEGARVTVRYLSSTSLGLDWPVRKVGTDFVALLTDNGEEKVIPRTRISEFIVTKRTQNTHS